jgi:ATP-dependent protease HslVU (ClpYQ) peptidase subunit
MPTAIIRNYTGDAFVIAADGIAQDKDGTVMTRSRQKIFQFGDNKWLAYAFAGRVAIGPDEGSEIWFDFRERINEAVLALPLNQ